MIADYETPDTANDDRRRRRRPTPWWQYCMAVACVLLTISILMPSLNRPSPYHGNRGKCMSQLRSIGLAIELYANENRGQMPPDLATIAETEDVVGDVLICPSTDQHGITIAPNAVRASAAAGQLSYIYIGSGVFTSLTRDDVVIYESAGNHGNDNEYNVLFGDGHVESLDAATTRPIAQQRAAGIAPVKLAKNRSIVLGSR